MPNFQPKIYSLSTLNIRQHFNCDYRFHTFRTDFSGESGSGKSLIADFIQLLLVGSSVFKSGTEGVKQRDTSGLVLKSAAGKYGRGYIIINIELQPKSYITLGGYLESSSSQMQFFIIQAGYDFEEVLQPMPHPVFFRDLLVDGKIETLDNLQKHFLDKGYLRSLNNKKYHQLLFSNGILAIDLSQSRQSLKGFGAIIRAFSRGKGFFTDSDALKTFLFGDDDQKQLMDKYRDEVQNISMDQQQHQRLLEEIGTIRTKEQKIKSVLQSYKNYQSLKLKFSQENVSFWYQANLNVQTGIDEANRRFKSSAIEKLLINKKILKLNTDEIDLKRHSFNDLEFKIRTAGSEREKLDLQLQQAKRSLEESSKHKTTIDFVEKFIAGDQMDIAALRSLYVEERQKIRDRDLLKEFQSFLLQHNIIQEFQQSLWLKEFSTARELSAKQLENLQQEMKKLEVQLVFSDLDNPSSLAHWAMANLKLPLSLELESMLVHFQPLPRSQPAIFKAYERYLPFPQRLFDSPVIFPSTNNGFWIELDGIYEFVQFVTVQYLNKPTGDIKLSDLSLSSLKEQLNELRNSALSLKNIKDKLENFPLLEKAIALYKEDNIELFNVVEELAELVPSEFERYIETYESSSEYLKDYEFHKNAFELAFQDAQANEFATSNSEHKLKEIRDYMERYFGGDDFDFLLKENERKMATLETAFDEFLHQGNETIKAIQKAEERLFSIVPSLNRLHEQALVAEKNFEQQERDLDQKMKYSLLSSQKLDDARLQYLRDHERDFDPVMDLISVSNQPDESLSTDAGSEFRANYKLAGDGIEDKTILADFSIGVLANKLLPTVFPTQQIEEELIGEQIERRLIDLTNDLQQIGSRKIEILHNVFNEVQKTYNGYLTKVQKIGNYLRSKNRQITGGNHATLEPKPAPGYPDEWMKVFRKRLNSELQNTGIFAPNNKQDIDEIMIAVFREEGGTRDATVQDLLNPRSYFDLLFDIKLDDGESNAGSNGQTYTANALLCLARLSLIEDNSRSGIRVMPIDEAEGLGSNYEMLHTLAKKENYQLVTMSIETAGDINGDGQYIYIMNDNKDADKSSYVPPMGIFNNGPVTSEIDAIFEQP